MAILAAAAILRFWGTFDSTFFIYDEGIYVPSAISLGEYGTPDKGNWEHPQLGSLLLLGAIKVFGNNPHGWRIMGVLFGTATVAAVYLVGRRLYPSPSGQAPLVAAAILALEPFHAFYSRTIVMEMPATFFFLMFVCFLLDYVQGRRHLLMPAGIFLGLMMATKGGYFVTSTLLLAGYALYAARSDGERIPIVLTEFTAMLVILPGAVYLLSFAVWFGRGYSLTEFVQMRLDAVYYLRNLSESAFMYGQKALDFGGAPWEWFLKPLVYGNHIGAVEGYDRFLLEINNPPLRLLVVPSVAFLLYAGVKRRDMHELMAPLLFCSCYLLFIILSRPMFSSSALVLLPCAYLCVARTVDRFAQRYGGQARMHALFLLFVVSWGLYTFPLYASFSVPVALYRPILSVTNFLGVAQ